MPSRNEFTKDSDDWKFVGDYWNKSKVSEGQADIFWKNTSWNEKKTLSQKKEKSTYKQNRAESVPFLIVFTANVYWRARLGAADKTL